MKSKKPKEINAAKRYLVHVTAGKRHLIVLLGALQIVSGLLGTGSALVLRRVVNGAVSGDAALFTRFFIAFLAVILTQIVLNALNRHFTESARTDFENACKDRLFSVLMAKDYASVTAKHSGEWMNRLTSDTMVVAGGLTDILPGACGTVVRLFAAAAAIALLEVRFLFLIIPCGVVLMLCSAHFRKLLKAQHRGIQEADGALRIYMQERLSALLIIRTFLKGDASIRGAREKMAAHKNARMRRMRYSNLFSTLFALAMQGMYVLGVFYGAYGILHGTVSYGNLVAIMQLINQVRAPFHGMSGYLPRYYAMLSSAERLAEIETADDAAEILEDNASSRFAAPAFYRDSFTGFTFEDVRFSYPDGEEVLNGLSFPVPKGEVTALCGRSGCGKSTALKLLMCVYPPGGGGIYMNLADGGREEVTAAVLPLFAYVPQGNLLMSGTIREVLTFGEEARMQDEELLYKALRVACAEDFVSDLPDGLDAMLGEQGAGLSEGQMQRLAIARAIVFDHPVLLLDEATSALDEKTEAQLLMNLRAMTDKTVVIVTHRKTVMDAADRVVEME